jgi:CelD/BcsL family acetyltransferase involved in cellulose biosynthesis
MSRPTSIAGGAPEAPRIRVRLEPVLDLDRLGEAWCALEPRSEPSFFRSWGWIGCWLRHLPPDRQPLAAIATRDDEVVGLGVFLARRERRHGFLAAHGLHLHQSGEPGLDSPFIEHNGLVADRARAPAVWAAIFGLLTRRGAWDQVLLPGVASPTLELCLGAARAQGRHVTVRQKSRAAHLELAALRRSGRDLADSLSRNTRHQLARARRLYQTIGPLALRSAQSSEEALTMLEQLKALHQKSWQRRGRPGCFATPFFETFHRDLIGSRFRHGEIQVQCATAGNQAIGYLYNFAYGDRVYAYQSGFDYVADGRLKPGLVTHALAIERAMRDGFAIYDFMAGENRLKASLASHWSDTVWLRVQRPSAALWLKRHLAIAKNRVTGAGPLRLGIVFGQAADGPVLARQLRGRPESGAERAVGPSRSARAGAARIYRETSGSAG